MINYLKENEKNIWKEDKRKFHSVSEPSLLWLTVSQPFSETIIQIAKLNGKKKIATLQDLIIHTTLFSETRIKTKKYKVIFGGEHMHMHAYVLTCLLVHHRDKIVGTPPKERYFFLTLTITLHNDHMTQYYLIISTALRDLAVCFLNSTGPRLHYPSINLFLSVK